MRDEYLHPAFDRGDVSVGCDGRDPLDPLDPLDPSEYM